MILDNHYRFKKGIFIEENDHSIIYELQTFFNLSSIKNGEFLSIYQKTSSIQKGMYILFNNAK